ncbi:MAG: hypothetical protein M1281_09070 [Chloroflexi bacterium]|nr:hypothetical protein [Chloroflexota bacterium]
MTYNSSWSPYMGSGAVLLTIVLVIITGALVILGTRLRRPLGATRPGRTVTFFLFVMWILSIVTDTNSTRVYGLAFQQQRASGQVGKFVLPPDRILPVTVISVLVTFVVILILCRHHGWKMALGNAILGTMAAPWIFELPFDLIIVGKVYTPLPATPFRGLYFLPLFLIEISTFSLLTLSPLVRLSRATLFSLAGMFFVFAIWAAFGFVYPGTPIPIALNAISKVLCFVAAITLFLPLKGIAAQEKVLL